MFVCSQTDHSKQNAPNRFAKQIYFSFLGSGWKMFSHTVLSNLIKNWDICQWQVPRLRVKSPPLNLP